MRSTTLLLACVLLSGGLFSQQDKITFLNVKEKVTAVCGELPDVSDVKVKSKCKGQITLTHQDISPGDCGAVLRTITAKDECGNQHYVNQIIQFEDKEAPVFVKTPPDLEFDNRVDFMNSPDVFFPEVSDNCSTDIKTNIVQKDEVQGDTFYVYRTYIAVDLCGNTVEHTQTIKFNLSQ